MGVTVVGHYSSLPEARVACGALQSAGFLAWVFDDHFGTMVWAEQIVLGGFRLVVPTSDGREAWELLREVQPVRETIDPRTGRPDFWACFALAALAWGVAWAWVAYRARPTWWTAVGFAVQGGAFLVLDLYLLSWFISRLIARTLHLH